jgi:hypothetical protein
MSNDEIIIIVTRMKGTDNEFKFYFGNGEKKCVVLQYDNQAKHFNSIPDNSFIANSKIIFFNGRAKSSYNDFKKMIEQLLLSNKNILIALHPGGRSNHDHARKILNLPDNISSVEYTIGGAVDTSDNPIVILGKSIGKRMKGENADNLEDKITAVRNLIIKKNPVLPNLLHLFLPLDIDMQALEMICNDENLKVEDKKVQKIKDYLLDTEIGMLKDESVNYHKKLEDAKGMIKGVDELKNNNTLQKLLELKLEDDKISGFLKLLDDTKQSIIVSNSDLSDDDLKNVIQYFGRDGGWEIEGATPKIIISFHDWYCALAACLKDLAGEVKGGR